MEAMIYCLEPSSGAMNLAVPRTEKDVVTGERLRCRCEESRSVVIGACTWVLWIREPYCRASVDLVMMELAFEHIAAVSSDVEIDLAWRIWLNIG